MRILSKTTAAAVFGMASLGCGVSAVADEACFEAFDGNAHYQFDVSNKTLKAAGTATFSGVVFGPVFASCAGLDRWPIVASKTTKGNSVILGFRVFSVDAAACGAVDYIAELAKKTLTGPLQLHNDRTNTSNTSILELQDCVAVPDAPAAGSSLASGEPDAAGNPR